MLFISRRFPSQKASNSIFGEDLIYGVADSDDGVEDRCDAETIINLISGYGIKIEGVDFRTNGGRRFDISRSDIRVVQCDRWAKAESAKLKMLHGVEVITFKDQITNISCNISRDVSVRLSKYGSSCAGYVFYDSDIKGPGRLTIVLDNDIKLSKYTLWWLDNVNVLVDVTEVTDEEKLKRLYFNFMGNQFWDGTLFDYFKHIVDEPSRKELYIARGLVEGRLDKECGGADELIQDTALVERRLVEQYWGRFSAVCETFPSCKNTYNDRVAANGGKLVASDLNKLIDMKLRGYEFYEIGMREPDRIIRIMRCGNGFDITGFKWFVNFLGMFNTDSRRVDMFGKFVSDIIDWYINTD